LIEETGKQTFRWVGLDEFAKVPLVRAADSHKGTFGHVLFVAGSAGKSGAAILAGYASLRTGAGLTTIACPEASQPIIAAAHPEYMTAPLAATKSGALGARSLLDGTFDELEEGKSVLAIGPGLGTHKQTQEFVRTLVTKTDLPVVLDADGLNAFRGQSALLKKRAAKFLCVTPHPGEMARLLGVSTKLVQVDRLAAARRAAKSWNAHIVLKGFHTILAAPDGRTWVNTTGGPGLAKGGSGDVLTGVLAALTAQFGTDDWLRVLALGVYLHGVSSNTLEWEMEPSGILAEEVAKGIPGAREYLLREIQYGG
jgi:NAD(P)H-hydrate epimerase